MRASHATISFLVQFFLSKNKARPIATVARSDQQPPSAPKALVAEPALSGSEVPKKDGKATQKKGTQLVAPESTTPDDPSAPPGAASGTPKTRKDEGFPTWDFDLMKFRLHQRIVSCIYTHI